ncbi:MULTISPECIES: M20/M25/M40 family metallo-hydrolase [Rhizobium]|uniref:Acetylornithine deacetylase/succinyl-diaminopimelate desuccinylase-like protein n=1 Tax=Rhizobium paranaense TaxID=1650438 RepID=A0A7W8XS92_9HYPH|nr:M20/M25/M40 family metallo-hydrolase [Rhizobium paranaense]MBB5574628.1 acetylornithine deacetylase/succinyl-diaminopimelate desuccinylase-like protein [Rhizobium paranaense]
MRVPSDLLAAATKDLADLVSIPSVSTRGDGLGACADAVEALLQDAGFRTEQHPGDVGPFVVGETGEGPFTLIIYNHYDVQPEEPVDLWTDPPFVLSERDGRLYGRGAADDKGEFVSRLAGWRLFRSKHPEPLPYKLIWIVEGEEEIGSPSLTRFLKTRFPDTKADLCWWEYGEVDRTGRPIILMGFKGVLAVELDCRTARADLHSSLGAIFDNPLWRLASAVSSLRDASGRILIEGFYDDIVAPEPYSRELTATAPFPLEDLQAETGGHRLLNGVDATTFYGHLNFEPCLNVNGFHGGFGGEGAKTVLPCSGVVKLDFRLAPGQHPVRIAQLLRAHLDEIGFGDIELRVLDAEVLGVRSDPSHVAVGIGAALLEKSFGRPAIIQPSSAASGLAHPFVHAFGATLFGAGLTHHGAMLHSLDENIIVEQFENMIGFSSDFFAALAENVGKQSPEAPND